MFEFKTKKPEESSSNWKPWHKDWDAITSNYLEDDAIIDDAKYRYNRKGFLEDDERSDDSILIVDPGWDDYWVNQLVAKIFLAPRFDNVLASLGGVREACRMEYWKALKLEMKM
ncbi:hypothetical protein Tco_1538887 [Tanacetum coccineum]